MTLKQKIKLYMKSPDYYNGVTNACFNTFTLIIILHWFGYDIIQWIWIPLYVMVTDWISTVVGRRIMGKWRIG